jgi:ureidoglycolate hydrolase
MRTVILKVQKMTRESFAPFGVLIDSRGAVEVDLGQAQCLTGATAERRPFAFEFMARHKQTMQVFSPLVGSQCVIAVAPPNESGTPDVEKVTAFLWTGVCRMRIAGDLAYAAVSCGGVGVVSRRGQKRNAG